MPRLTFQPSDPHANWQRLPDALPAPTWTLLQAIVARAAARGWPLYLVGGFVRDWLLGRPSLDLDLVTEAHAPTLAREVAAALGGRVVEHRAFLTAKWWLPEPAALAARLGLSQLPAAGELPPHLDFVTARAEHYPHPAALPQVRPADLRADLRRRDFTINAMAVELTPRPGAFHDPFGGHADLAAGVLRVLHARSFRDDPTRLFRAVRYRVRYRLRLSPETAAQWPEGLAHVPALSGDRVRHELDRVLDEPLAPRMVRDLGRRGLAAAVHPRLPGGRAAARRVARGLTPQARALAHAWGLTPTAAAGVPRAVRYALWWATLGVRATRALAERLHAPRALREVTEAATQLWRTRRTWAGYGPAALTFFLERFPLEAVLAAALLTDDPELRQRLDAFARQWRHVQPLTTGRDLQALGLPPGPLYGQVLRALRAARLEGRVRTPEDEARLRAALVRTLQAIGQPGGRG